MQKHKTKLQERKESSSMKDSIISVPTRGRIFEGTVVTKFPKRITIEFERTIFVKKYERFYKKKTRIHARLPEFFEKEINIGDYIKVQECRPLSKIIHHIVIGKIKSYDGSINALQATSHSHYGGKKK